MKSKIKKILKEFICSHSSIRTETKSQINGDFFSVKSIIQCVDCEKTFIQHPRAECCYVRHTHTELVNQYWMTQFAEKMNKITSSQASMGCKL